MKNLSAILVLMVLSCGTVFALANPSAVYCNEMNSRYGGYSYAVQTDANSNEYSVCTMPDGTQCDAWAFLNGECGAKFSYCVKNGYGITTVSNGNYKYAACTRAPGGVSALSTTSGTPVMDLMNLSSELGGSIAPGAVKAQLNQMVGAVSRAAPMQSSYNATQFSYWDWRNPPANTIYAASNYPYFNTSMGWITSIKDQGACGSCWAFGTIGTVEARYNMVMNESRLQPYLSEQDEISCGNAGSCSGGWPVEALQDYETSGTVDNACFPYGDYHTSSGDSDVCSQRCTDYANRNWTITGFQDYADLSNAALEQILINDGPLNIVADASEWYYSGGILNCAAPSTFTDHDVVLVGYNDTGNPNTSYWIIKNSWGSGWGENGYLRAAFGCFDIGVEADSINGVTPPNFAPTITVNSPTQNVITTSPAVFNFSVNNRISPTSTCDLNINGAIVDTTSADNGTATVMTYPVPLGMQNNWNITCWETGLGIVASTQTQNLGLFISIQSPSGSSYNITSIPLDYSTINQSSCWYSLDNGPNVTLPGCGNTTLSSLPIGYHSLTVYENTTEGAVYYSTVAFIIDTATPSVTLNSPADSSISNSSTVAFDFTAIDNLSATMGCSLFLDNVLSQTNAYTPNDLATVFQVNSIPDGNHTWYVKCTNNAGNTGTSAARRLIVENYCPIITSPGTYTQPANYVGAPNDASVISGGDLACVEIASSNVVFDCAGHSINAGGASGTTFGIFLNTVGNVTVKNCPGISNYTDGIYVYQSANSVFTNDNASGNAFGFYMVGSEFDQFSNDTASDNGYSGFEFTNGSVDNTITHSVLGGSQDRGLSFEVNSGGNQIVGNTVTGGSWNGIYFGTQSSHNIVLNNNVSNNPAAEAIKFENHSDFNTVEDNNIAYNGGWAVAIHDSDSETIGYNSLVDNANCMHYTDANSSVINENAMSAYGPCFQMDGGSTNNTISNNTEYGSSDGFDIISSPGNDILGNTASNNSDTGLLVYDSNNTFVQGMHLSDNGADVLVQDDSGSPLILNLSGVVFDSPPGTMQDYTTLSINDTVSSGEAYSISWSTNTSALPPGDISFAQKFVAIRAVNGTPSIDSAVWSWSASELNGYDESWLRLFDYGASWQMLNASPNTMAHSLSATGIAADAVYGVLELNGMPDIILNAPGNGSLSSASSMAFNFTLMNGRSATAGCSIFLDGALNQTNHSVANGTATVFTISHIADGTHSWYIQCTDNANNTETSATNTFSVDTVPPSVILNSPADRSSFNSSTVAFGFTATDALSATMGCSLFLDNALSQNELLGGQQHRGNFHNQRHKRREPQLVRPMHRPRGQHRHERHQELHGADQLPDHQHERHVYPERGRHRSAEHRTPGAGHRLRGHHDV